jgi:GntR family transcriptional regulator, sialic acid-inducible nan operon repressor
MSVLLKRRKRADDVMDGIETLITSGGIVAGGELPSEKELMDRFGVGRPAVREALFKLAQNGLLEISSGRRARVAPPGSEPLASQLSVLMKRFTAAPRGQEHVTQARLLFECGLAWQSAQIATDADIARLRSALDANAAALGDRTEFIRTDVAFHYQLALIPNNPIFMVIHDVIVGWLVDQRTTTINMPEADTLSVRDHTAIYAAVAARDPARAFHEMASHLKLVSSLYAESKRLTAEILRNATRKAANRIEHEQAALWASTFGAVRNPAKAMDAGLGTGTATPVARKPKRAGGK